MESGESPNVLTVIAAHSSWILAVLFHCGPHVSARPQLSIMQQQILQQRQKVMQMMHAMHTIQVMQGMQMVHAMHVVQVMHAMHAMQMK